MTDWFDATPGEGTRAMLAKVERENAALLCRVAKPEARADADHECEVTYERLYWSLRKRVRAALHRARSFHPVRSREWGDGAGYVESLVAGALEEDAEPESNPRPEQVGEGSTCSACRGSGYDAVTSVDPKRGGPCKVCSGTGWLKGPVLAEPEPKPRWMNANEAEETVQVGDLVEVKMRDPHYSGRGRVSHCGPHAIQLGDPVELGVVWDEPGLRVRVIEAATEPKARWMTGPEVKQVLRPGQSVEVRGDNTHWCGVYTVREVGTWGFWTHRGLYLGWGINGLQVRVIDEGGGDDE